MKNGLTSRIFTIVICIIFLLASQGITALAESDTYNSGGTPQKSDVGYSNYKKIKSSDAHYGWELGEFKISGYTQKIEKDGKVIFLKTANDKVKLSFNLQQDIDELNGDKALVISEDTDGYDDNFGISKKDRTNFGRGALLVKQMDSQNEKKQVLYKDYLVGVAKGADTEVILFEEGDYEIALDYEITKKRWGIIPDSHRNYQIRTEFSVRNGNCMVYPFDVKTGSELVNSSFTENGFRIDLAKSKYLSVNVKKSSFIEKDGELVKDIRSNRAAKDGEEFTADGVYDITVKNLYTEETTTKEIYVGANFIKELLAEGAAIRDDGTISLPSHEIIEAEETDEQESFEAPTPSGVEDESNIQKDLSNDMKTRGNGWIVAGALIIVISCFVISNIIKAKKRVAIQNLPEDPEEMLITEGDEDTEETETCEE